MSQEEFTQLKDALVKKFSSEYKSEIIGGASAEGNSEAAEIKVAVDQMKI